MTEKFRLLQWKGVRRWAVWTHLGPRYTMGFRKFLLRSPPIRELFIAYRAAGVSYVMHPQRFYPSPAGLERNLDYRGFEKPPL